MNWWRSPFHPLLPPGSPCPAVASATASWSTSRLVKTIQSTIFRPCAFSWKKVKGEWSRSGNQGQTGHHEMQQVSPGVAGQMGQKWALINWPLMFCGGLGRGCLIWIFLPRSLTVDVTFSNQAAMPHCWKVYIYRAKDSYWRLYWWTQHLIITILPICIQFSKIKYVRITMKLKGKIRSRTDFHNEIVITHLCGLVVTLYYCF